MYIMIAIVTTVRSFKPIAIRVIKAGQTKVETVLVEDLPSMKGKISNIRIEGKKIICKDIAKYPLIELRDSGDYIDVDAEFNVRNYENNQSINQITNIENMVKLSENEFGVVVAKCDGSIHTYLNSELQNLSIINVENLDKTTYEEFKEDLRLKDKLNKQSKKLKILGKSLEQMYEYDGLTCLLAKNVDGDIQKLYFKYIAEYAFLESNISYINLENVTDIGVKAFDSTKLLTTVIFGDGLEVVDDFAFCNSGIASIIFPKSLKVLGAGVLKYCHSLKCLDIQSEYLKSIPDQFASYCYNLETVNLSSKIEEIRNTAFFDCNLELSGNTFRNIKVIGDSAFSGNEKACCEELNLENAIEIRMYAFRQSGVHSIKFGNNPVKVYENAFENCKSLRQLYGKVVELGKNAFSESSIEYFDASELRIIPFGAFLKCKNIEKVTVSNKLEKIHAMAFHGSGIQVIEGLYECENTLNICGCAFTDSGITSFKCRSIAELCGQTFGGSQLEEFECDRVGKIQDFQTDCNFGNCDRLKRISIKEIGNNQLNFLLAKNCAELEEVELGFNNNCEINKESDYLFSQVPKLRKIKILKGAKNWEDRYLHRLVHCADGQTIEIEIAEGNRKVTIGNSVKD